MKLQFLGANRQVTGSRYLLEAAELCVVVDCGMFQERQFVERNWQAPLITPRKVDYLLLTHAHLDHVGLIPRLVQLGFKGRILATAPTVELVEIVLRDSAKIQEEDAAYKKKRHRREKRKGKHPEEPLYSMADVEKSLGLFQEVSFHKPEPLNSHLSVTWHEAGHILGAGMLEMEVKHDGQSRRIIFSGDIGQWGKPIIRNPSQFDS
ncbi:MAG: MBL fold metallo-hydrolase, partial [Phycisphaerae bacterium]|nr:MBL fold metallo-hydrolase [Phycisphaerae bacterium]